MGIAREAWPVIGVVGGVLAPVAIIGVLAGHPAAVVPLLVAVAFCLFFFRDPDRRAPADERLVVSPADGRVLTVGEAPATPLDGAATRISIFMSPLDVHVNRHPVSGRVEHVQHTEGKFRAAFADKASLDNERNALVVAAPGNRRYLVVQIAGAVARRIICWARPGDAACRGERFGLIMFGSRVDLFLPRDVRPVVRPGDRVRAGVTVVAEVPA